MSDYRGCYACGSEFTFAMIRGLAYCHACAEVEESYLPRPLKARLNAAKKAGNREDLERLTWVATFLGRTGPPAAG